MFNFALFEGTAIHNIESVEVLLRLGSCCSENSKTVEPSLRECAVDSGCQSPTAADSASATHDKRGSHDHRNHPSA